MSLQPANAFFRTRTAKVDRSTKGGMNIANILQRAII